MPTLASLLLPPDPSFVARDPAKVASTNYERHVGRGIPSSGNRGALSAFATGAPTSDGASFEARVQTSGGLLAGASWAWRYIGEGNDWWRGSNDLRAMHSFSDPFGGAVYGWGASAVYVPALRREIVYVAGRQGGSTSTNTLLVRYREVDRVEVPWLSSTVTLSRGIDNNGDQGCGFDVVAMPDGSLRMIVRYESDLDLYSSLDGLTWSLVANNVYSRFTGRRSNTILGLRMAESGSYLRVVCVDNDVADAGLGFTVTSLLSSDGGATWTETNTVDGDYIDANSATATASGSARFVVDLAGAGDGGGSFLLAVKSATAQVSVYTSSGSEGWTLTDFPSSTGTPGALSMSLGGTFGNSVGRVFLARGPDYLHCLVEVYETAYARWTLQRREVDLRSSLATATWSTFSATDARMDGSNGTLLYAPSRGKLVHIGHSLVLFAGLLDTDAGVEQVGTVYFRREGWSLRPLIDVSPDGAYSSFAVDTFGYQPNGPLFGETEWATWMGRPGPAGGTWASPDTSWERFYAGGVTCNWTTDRLRITDAGSGSRYHYYRWADPTGVSTTSAGGTLPASSWAIGESTVDGPDGSLIEWTAKVSGGLTSDNVVGVVVRSRPRSGSTSGNGMSLVLRMMDARVVVYDFGASVALATLTPDASVYGSTPFALDYWEYRLAFQPEPPSTVCACVLSVRRVDKEDWLSTARLLPSMSAVLTMQSLDFGSLAHSGGTGSTSSWKSMRIKQGNALGQVDLAGVYPVPGRVKPDTVRGREVSPFPVYLDDGVDLSWGGGGGFDGDLFTSTLSNQFALRNTAISSPRFEWRGASQTTPTSALPVSSLDYSSGSSSAARFRHDAIGVFGTNAETVEVRYSNDPSFASYTSAGTLSLTRFSGLRVSSVDGNLVTVSGLTANDGEVGSALGRTFYARVTSDVPAGYADAREWIVEQHRGSSLLLRTSTALTTSLVGATLAIRSDRGVLLYNSAVSGAYVRVRASNAYPAEGYPRLGTLHPSLRIDFPAPLSWDHDDDSAETVTQFRSRSAVAWAYTEGPSRRSLSARIEGDATRERQRVRDILRTTAGYSEFAAVLVRDDGNLRDAESVVLGRLSGGIDLSNPGWRLDDYGAWRPVGDLRLRFEEEV